ncbi:unnamed protein product [Miscanthus lutarioriparius]|uniref:Protein DETOXIFICATION n=1 Tax=Miscanthus lutarioriparius TaxID=422564 RepID=A0A811NIL3_9POAL|nr:unnamed protein product [Miscanthus lutarioriparius]
MAVAVAVDVAAPAAAAPQNGTAVLAENGDVAAPAAPKNGTAAPAENGDGGGSELLGGPRWTGLHLFFMNVRSVFKLDEVGAEVLGIAVSASLALTADPLASLIDTAFIGRLGSVEIAAVGVAIAVFNQVMKVCIYPFVSVTTSFVAEEHAVLSKGGAKVIDDGVEEEEVEQGPDHTASGADLEKQQQPADEAAAKSGGDELAGGKGCAPAVVAGRRSGKKSGNRRFVPSVTSALIVGAFLGLFQTVLLVAAGKPLLRLMGVKPGSPMVIPALRYLTLRALGDPVVLLSLATQGVFRGFKDTKTGRRRGKHCAGSDPDIRLPHGRDRSSHRPCSFPVPDNADDAEQAGEEGGRRPAQPEMPQIPALPRMRIPSVGTGGGRDVLRDAGGVAGRSPRADCHGRLPDLHPGLAGHVPPRRRVAVASQAMIASAFAKEDRYKVAATTARVLQLGVFLGVALTALLGVGLQFRAGAFTSDAAVIKTIRKGVPFVAGTQTLNTLAFVFDGINFGASDYAFSAYSMIGVAAVSIPSLVSLSSHGGFVALTIYMGVRALASTWRMAAAQGPWKFLRQ